MADIACLAARLVVEVDGPSHTVAGASERDDKRTRWLEAEGYRVLRFWNSEITENLDGVLQAIYAAVHGAIDAESKPLKHERRDRVSRGVTPPRRASRADPPPPGEGEAAPAPAHRGSKRDA